MATATNYKHKDGKIQKYPQKRIVKIMEFAEMAKLTCMVRNKATSTLKTGNFLWTFCRKWKKK